MTPRTLPRAARAASGERIPPAGTPVAIYVRISHDMRGDAEGVEDQEKAARALCARRRWKVVKAYVENDVSASTNSSKPRPEYDAMLAAVRTGEVRAIIAYSNARLTRRPLELEGLIRLHAETGVYIATIVSGDDDLSTADGRMVARIKASVDAAEAERTSERAKERLARRREKGRMPTGQIPFGYIGEWEVKGDKRSYRIRIDKAAAEEIQKACNDILAGATLTTVLRRWQATGVKTRDGKEWTSITTLRRCLTNPRLAGLIPHDGEIVGSCEHWPTILDLAVHEAVVDELDGRTKGRRFGVRPRRHLLPGFVFCGGTMPDGTLCGHHMDAHVTEASAKFRANNRYLCRSATGGCGKVTRHKPWLDAYVHEWVKVRIVAEYQGQAVADEPDEAAELDKAIAATQGEIDRLMDAVMAGVFTRDEATGKVAPVRAELNRLKALRSKVVRTTTIERSDLLALWEDAEPETLGERRAILARYVSRVIIKPLPARMGWGIRRPIPPDSVEILPA